MMRLIWITNTFPTPAAPKQGAFNAVLADALAQQHDLHVIAPIPWTTRLRPQSRLRPIQAPYGLAHPRYYYPPKLARSRYGTFHWWSIRAAVQQLLERHRPDAVLGYWAHPDGESALRAACTAGVPAVIMVGGSDIRLLARDAARGEAIQRVLMAAQRVVTFSQELQQQVTRLQVPLEKTRVLYRGIPLDVFSPGDRRAARQRLGLPISDCIALWVGRLEAVKDPELMIRVAAAWTGQKTMPSRRVYMVGEGPLRSRLRRQIAAMQLDRRVSLVGGLFQHQVADWYRAADVTVLTSRSEGVPNVLLESLGCGTPFAAANVGGVREIMTPGVDHLFSAGDADAGARAIDRCLASVRGTPAVRAFTPASHHQAADQLTDIIAQAIGDHRQAAGDANWHRPCA